MLMKLARDQCPACQCDLSSISVVLVGDRTRVLSGAQHECEADLGVCSGSVGVAAILGLRLGVAPIASAVAAGRRVLLGSIAAAAAAAVAWATTCRVCAQSGARTMRRACRHPPSTYQCSCTAVQAAVSADPAT